MDRLRFSQQPYKVSVLLSIFWVRRPEIREVSSFVLSPLRTELDMKLGVPGLMCHRLSPWPADRGVHCAPSDLSSLGLRWRPQKIPFPQTAHETEEYFPKMGAVSSPDHQPAPAFTW